MIRKKILIIQRRSGIGDMCAFLPFIRKIIEYRKGSDVYIFTSSRSKADELLENDPVIKNIVFYENYKTTKDFIRFLKFNSFNEVFIFHYSFRFFLLCFILRIKKIFIYGLLKRKRNNIIEEAKNFTLKSLKISKLDTIFKCKIYTKDLNIKKKQEIVIGIGGSGQNKKWPIENFIKLIEMINDYKKSSFLIAGGQDENKEAEEMIGILKDVEIISLCKLNIKSAIDKINSAKLYIGNDTGFMHICGSLGIKSYGLFGDTPTNYVDYNNLITPLIPENFNKISHDSMAMNKILVDYVYKKILNNL